MHKSGHRKLFACIGLAFACLCPPASAFADIYGRLRFQISIDHARQAYSSVRLTLRDMSGVNGDITFATRSSLSVLSPPLIDADWRLVRVEAVAASSPRAIGAASPRPTPFSVPQQAVLAVTPDATSPVTIRLDAAALRVTQVNDSSYATQTGSVTRRSRDFITRIPATGNDSQSLGRVLTTVP